MGLKLSKKFEAAVLFAIKHHAGQNRKGSGAPYISHPFAVASLVMEYGGTEEQVLAALLHDTIEDCGVTREEIAAEFGEIVAQIVADLSDWSGPAGARKSAWRGRKEKYLAHLSTAHPDSALVSAADKLHNARSIAHDTHHYGPEVWSRFSAKPDEILWYYHSLLKFFEGWIKTNADKHPRFPALVAELKLAIAKMHLPPR